MPPYEDSLRKGNETRYPDRTDWPTVGSALPLEFTYIRTGKAISWQRAIVRGLLTCLWLLMKWVDILGLTQFQTNLSKQPQTQLWSKIGWICIALAWTRGKVVTQRSKHINSWRSILMYWSNFHNDGGSEFGDHFESMCKRLGIECFYVRTCLFRTSCSEHRGTTQIEQAQQVQSSEQTVPELKAECHTSLTTPIGRSERIHERIQSAAEHEQLPRKVVLEKEQK